MDLMDILTIVISLIVGGAAGFFYAQKRFKKELAENPPINEKMIRAMYMQMGRKPSEAQIRQTINSMNQYKK
ncbi:YneF family protein [Mycoplasma sp. P36-A1]|uniref:YneF family protein n=1 Tax=Mycoplasma sp. P36-A1 TaxID=3252900 RepID=UPI003C2D5A1A